MFVAAHVGALAFLCSAIGNATLNFKETAQNVRHPLRFCRALTHGLCIPHAVERRMCSEPVPKPRGVAQYRTQDPLPERRRIHGASHAQYAGTRQCSIWICPASKCVIQSMHSKLPQMPRVLRTCAGTQRRSTGRSTEPSQAHSTALKLPIVGISTSTCCVGMMEYNYHNATKTRDASNALIQLGLD